jgi:hypothetical protein
MDQQLAHVKRRDISPQRHDSVTHFDGRAPGDGRAQSAKIIPQADNQVLVRRECKCSGHQFELTLRGRRRYTTSAVAANVTVQIRIAGGSGTTVVPVGSPST